MLGLPRGQGHCLAGAQDQGESSWGCKEQQKRVRRGRGGCREGPAAATAGPDVPGSDAQHKITRPPLWLLRRADHDPQDQNRVPDQNLPWANPISRARSWARLGPAWLHPTLKTKQPKSPLDEPLADFPCVSSLHWRQYLLAEGRGMQNKLQKGTVLWEKAA